jgi:predicted double-glycine peptidase
MALCAAQSAWLDVPWVEQVDAGCGPAAIAMVMQYWIRQDHRLDPAAADADRIRKTMSSALSKKGTSGEALKAYLQQHGFDAYVIDGELNDLRQHLAKGRPLIVCLGPRGPQAPLHYAVVVGVSDDAVVLNDSARGKFFREKTQDFLRDWKLTGNWTMLAVPRQGA